MLKTILLLTPIYVTLFWSLVLNFNRKNRVAPQDFLGKFMLAACFVYVSHFLYYSQFITAYLHIDAFYQLASLLVYPMFYVYVRLLTVDRNFSLSRHFKYLCTPIFLAFLYFIATSTLPEGMHQKFCFEANNDFDNSFLFLSIVLYLIKIVGLTQIALVVWHSHKLITRYQERAAQYYSDEPETMIDMLKLQNFAMLIMGITSLMLLVLGRLYFVGEWEIIGISIASIVFSTMLFVLGWLGSKQSVINPTFELIANNIEEINSDNEKKYLKSEIEQKIQEVMLNKKAYLNPKLNIRDLALLMGTNRTALSNYINKEYGLNYCTFVNNYRIKDLEQCVREHPNSDNETLAESCGFGSIDSMKRAIQTKTNMRFFDWKRSIQTI